MPNLRALAVVKAAWLEEGSRPRGKRHSGDELEFLPAALEVMETPVTRVASSRPPASRHEGESRQFQ